MCVCVFFSSWHCWHIISWCHASHQIPRLIFILLMNAQNDVWTHKLFCHISRPWPPSHHFTWWQSFTFIFSHNINVQSNHLCSQTNQFHFMLQGLWNSITFNLISSMNFFGSNPLVSYFWISFKMFSPQMCTRNAKENLAKLGTPSHLRHSSSTCRSCT